MLNKILEQLELEKISHPVDAWDAGWIEAIEKAISIVKEAAKIPISKENAERNEFLRKHFGA